MNLKKQKKKEQKENIKQGVQLKSRSKALVLHNIYTRIIKAVKDSPVDEMMYMTIGSQALRYGFQKWLDLNKPSGGPEQFLSRDLKIEILKAVTKDLVEISDEEIEKTFPKEEIQIVN